MRVARSFHEAAGLTWLSESQHADGGWGYGGVRGWFYTSGTSWAEPTCYAIMALRAAQTGSREVDRAASWLLRLADPGGGILPAPGIDQATAVTSLFILALSGDRRYDSAVARAVRWLVALSGAESSPLPRFMRALLSRRTPATEHRGWPWYPGTAAWVAPTALSLLALRKHVQDPVPPEIAARIWEGEQFLLSRRCPDHGWNHGGIGRANEIPSSYAETTGIALLALRNVAGSALTPSLDHAEQLYRDAKSGDGRNWIRLGLQAHGRPLESEPGPTRDWTVDDVALRLIVASAESGRNPFFQDSHG